MEHYFVFKKRRVSTKQSSVKPMGIVCFLKERKTSEPVLWEKSSTNQAVRSGIVEPPDTARRDRERFLIKGIVDSVGFFFLLLISVLSDSRCLTAVVE